MVETLNRNLLTAARRGDLPSLQLLLKQGAYVDWHDNRRDTALIVAAREGHFEICKELLRRGASVNMKNKWGSTAIHVASGYGHREVVLLLAISGSNVNEVDSAGDTPSHCAARWERIGALEDLYSNGADWYIPNNAGHDVLQSAQTDRKRVSAQFIDAVRTGRRKLERKSVDADNMAALEKDQVIKQLREEVDRLKANTNRRSEDCNTNKRSEESKPVRQAAKWIVQFRSECDFVHQVHLQERAEYLQTRIADESMQNSLLKRRIDLMKKDISNLNRQKEQLETRLHTQTQELDELMKKTREQSTQLSIQQRAIDSYSPRPAMGSGSQLDYFRAAKENAEAAFHKLQDKMTTYAQTKHIASQDIQINDSQLGRGFFSETHLGHWHGALVAIKSYNRGQYNRYLLRQELAIQSQLQHPHIASIYGFTPGEGIVVMVVEFFQGSIADLIQSQELVFGAKKHLTLREEVDICHNTVSGLLYLHQLKPQCIVHGHIRPTNVLLQSDMQAKLSDIVGPCCCDSTCDYSEDVFDYIAPERQNDSNIPRSPSTDMFSAGVTLSQLSLGRCSPTVMGHVYLRKRRSVYSLCVQDLCLQMSAEDAESRLTASEVVKILTDLQGSAAYKKCRPKRMVKRQFCCEAPVVLVDKPF